MIHVCGSICCIVALAFYLTSQRPGSEEGEFLKSATRVYELKDLERKVFPLTIAVSGRVGSETNLIKCEHNDTLGVILEETVEEEYLKRNWTFSWVPYSVLMEPVSKEVPWYLDDGTGRVNVSGAYNAIGLVLTFGSEVFEETEASFFQRIFDYLRGLKLLGVKRIERVLEIGTNLTVVGEAIKDSFGNVTIRKPEQGFFYVTPIPFDQLMSDTEEWWSWCFKNVSIVLAILGVILISKNGIVYFTENAMEMTKEILTARQRQRERERWERDVQEREQERWRQEWEQEQERWLQDSLRVTISNEAYKRPEPETGDLEGQDEKSDDLCVICYEKKYNAVFLPCSHLCCCRTCSSRVIICPLCRRQIDQVLNVFRH